MNKKNLLLILAPIIILISIYLSSIAPDLTWKYSSADGGDLISAAATSGVAHPTGYPSYLILARAFQGIPIGSLAYRTNLLSSVLILFSVVMVYQLIQSTDQSSIDANKRFGASLASLAFGLAPLIWKSAITTEVYALHLFFISTILFLANVKPTESKTNKRHVREGLVLGLALGNHVTALLTIPVVYYSEVKRFFRKITITKSRLFSKIGITVLVTGILYSTLIWRASNHSPVNWGNPTSLKSLWWLVSGSLYKSNLVSLSNEQILTRIQALPSVFIQQFGLPMLSVAAYGLISTRTKVDRLLLTTLWVFVAYSGFAVIYGTGDSQQYLLPAFISVAVWLAWGITNISAFLASKKKSAWLVLLLALLILTSRTYTRYAEIDLSQDYEARIFTDYVMEQAPENAILITDNDRETFSLWYAHYALGKRADVSVIARGLLAYNWYRENLAYHYENLNVPPLESQSWLDNLATFNERPICEVQLDFEKRLLCQK